MALDDESDRFAGMSSTERWIAEREEEQQVARGAYTCAQIRGEVLAFAQVS